MELDVFDAVGILMLFTFQLNRSFQVLEVGPLFSISEFEYHNRRQHPNVFEFHPTPISNLQA